MSTGEGGMNKDDERTVTVCASCLRACCWLGEFYCEDYKTANVTQKTITELRRLGREHSDYWKPERANG